MTDDLEKEAPLNRNLAHDQAGRRFVPVEGSRWGELILPSPQDASAIGEGGLRLLVVSAYTYSLPLLAAVFDFRRRNPRRTPGSRSKGRSPGSARPPDQPVTSRRRRNRRS